MPARIPLQFAHQCYLLLSFQVMTSFSPMLATNYFYNTNKIVPGFQGRPFCMDVKLDGERMLCHRDGNKVLSYKLPAALCFIMFYRVVHQVCAQTFHGPDERRLSSSTAFPDIGDIASL